VTCREEGPELERFARDEQDRVDVIGLGAGGDLSDAADFQAEVQVDAPLRMLFDASRESWRQLDVSYQPAAILYDASGRELQRWFGPLETDELVKALPAT
jgi:hypothetical protein